MIPIVITLFFPPLFLSFSRLGQKKNRLFFVLIGIALFLVAAFRDGDAVRDYANYVDWYNNKRGGVEISFFAIVWIVRHIFFDNVLFLFIIYALLGVCLKLKAIQELTALSFLSLLMYISNFYILHELTQIRAGVATGFLLLSIKPLYERDLKKFLFLATCATFFHYSGLLVFFLWIFKGDHINKYIFAMVVPLSYIFYFFNIDLIEVFIKFIQIGNVQEKYGVYKFALKRMKAEYGDINVFNIVFLTKCLIFYIILFKSRLIEKQNKYVNLLLKIEAVSLVSFVSLSAIPVFAFRIYEFFGVVEIILIPFIYYVFESKVLAKTMIVFIGFCLLGIIIFYNKLITF
jgi:hypothetical protein